MCLTATVHLEKKNKKNGLGKKLNENAEFMNIGWEYKVQAHTMLHFLDIL